MMLNVAVLIHVRAQISVRVHGCFFIFEIPEAKNHLEVCRRKHIISSGRIITRCHYWINLIGRTLAEAAITF